QQRDGPLQVPVAVVGGRPLQSGAQDRLEVLLPGGGMAVAAVIEQGAGCRRIEGAVYPAGDTPARDTERGGHRGEGAAFIDLEQGPGAAQQGGVLGAAELLAQPEALLGGEVESGHGIPPCHRATAGAGGGVYHFITDS